VSVGVAVDELVRGGFEFEELGEVDGAHSLAPVGCRGAVRRGHRLGVAGEHGADEVDLVDAANRQRFDEREHVLDGAHGRGLGAGGNEVGFGPHRFRGRAPAGPLGESVVDAASPDGEDLRVAGQPVEGHQLVFGGAVPGVGRERAGAGEDDRAVVLDGLVDLVVEFGREWEIVDLDCEGSDLGGVVVDELREDLGLVLGGEVVGNRDDQAPADGLDRAFLGREFGEVAGVFEGAVGGDVVGVGDVLGGVVDERGLHVVGFALSVLERERVGRVHSKRGRVEAQLLAVGGFVRGETLGPGVGGLVEVGSAPVGFRGVQRAGAGDHRFGVGGEA